MSEDVKPLTVDIVGSLIIVLQGIKEILNTLIVRVEYVESELEKLQT